MGLTPSFRRPNIVPAGAAHESVRSAIWSHDQSITDLNQAVAAQAKNIASIKSSATAATSGTSTTTQVSTENVTNNTTISGGVVNNQTGVAVYITAQGDNGALLIFADTSPVAVTLNNSVTLPWYCVVTNQSTGIVTLTPQQNTINGNASEIVPEGYFLSVYFDGTEFWAATIPIVPLSFIAVTHEFLTAYDATTGIFTAEQPAIADVSGLSAALALLAPLNSPPLTGTPTTPTASPGTDNTQIASTAYTDAAVLVEKNRAVAAEGLLAPSANPMFTGTVTQPTPSVITAATTATSATAGAATALPVTPLGYLEMSVNGVVVKFPYYAV